MAISKAGMPHSSLNAAVPRGAALGLPQSAVQVYVNTACARRHTSGPQHAHTRGYVDSGVWRRGLSPLGTLEYFSFFLACDNSRLTSVCMAVSWLLDPGAARHPLLSACPACRVKT